MLDRLYGDTLDVIFGICADYGIHLKHTEKRDVISRLKKFEGTKMNMDAVALAFISRLHKSGLIERVQGKARKSEKIEISHEGRLKLRKALA
jgi:hypothetical protein